MLFKSSIGYYLLISYFLFTNFSGHCQKRDQFEPVYEGRYLGFHFDDDFLFFDNRDEQYTGGLEFEYLSKIYRVKEKRGLFNPFCGGYRYWTGTFGSHLYTPYNVSDSLIILNDRPFSSYIYSSGGYTAYDSRYERKLTAELYLGIMGSPLPGRVQALIHTVGESPPTFGWQNRIADKEIFIPNLRVNFQKNLCSISGISILPIDWVQIGYLTEINTGLYMNTASAGLRFNGFNFAPVTRSKYTFDIGNRSAGNTKLRLNFYFNPEFQLVIQNTTLQSLAWIDSPYVITTDLMNRFVWVLDGGFNLNYGRFHMSYTIRARSKEFKKFQKDWHSWAGVTLGFSF